MITISDKIFLDVDTTQAHQKLDEVEQKRQDVETKASQTINQVDQQTTFAFQRVMSMARSAYLATAGFIRAAGVSVSYFYTSLISAGISAISIIKPLLAAEAVTPGMQITATIGLMNLEIAILAMINAQLKKTQIAQQLANANEALHNIQTFITYIPVLWK